MIESRERVAGRERLDTPDDAPDEMGNRERRQRYEQRKQLEGYRKYTLRFPENQKAIVTAFIQQLADLEAEGKQLPTEPDLRGWLAGDAADHRHYPAPAKPLSGVQPLSGEPPFAEPPFAESPVPRSQTAQAPQQLSSEAGKDRLSPLRQDRLRPLPALILRVQHVLARKNGRSMAAGGVAGIVLLLGLVYYALPGGASVTATAEPDRIVTIRELMQAEQAGYDAALKDIDMILEERRHQQDIPKRPD